MKFSVKEISSKLIQVKILKFEGFFGGVWMVKYICIVNKKDF